MKHCPCESCHNDLGGGACKISMEAECREGGGFELFEPKEQVEVVHKPDLPETILKWASISLCFLAYPVVIYKVYEWVKYLFF